ncbi:MAG TPA: amidohydrolase family protein [Syntrophorhabdaceae bacterium]|nr:amidohydrolase family protein [Syntrophorhabdaceae bacterium]
MKIDFHTHIYPDDIASSTINAVCERSGISAYTDGTIKGLKQSMKKAGIDISVVAAVPTKPNQVASIQKWLSSIRQPGIEALAAIHPDVSLTTDQLKNLKQEGFKGFKLHPDYQNFFVDEPRMFPIYEKIAEEDMFILFHAGVDRGLPYPVHGTPKGIARIHKNFPGLKIIAAHLGGEDVYEETLRYLVGQDIYMDTSFVLRIVPRPFLERIFKEHPIERILFASDSPWTDQKEELEFLLNLPFLSETDKEKICFYNAARLLGLAYPDIKPNNEVLTPNTIKGAQPC